MRTESLIHILVHKGKCIVKYIKKRGNTWYYRRRVPFSLLHLCNVKFINRALSANKKLALQLASRYENIFTMIDIGLKLNHDVSELIKELNFKPIVKINIYEQFIKHQDVSDNRKAKIERILSVLKVLLPNDLSTINMIILDTINQQLTKLPKRNIQKYRVKPIEELLKMKVPEAERLTIETINDYLKILNSFLKFAYERDAVDKPYTVNMSKKTTNNRDERLALPVDTIRQAINGAKRRELSSSFTLLYLSGLRPSEAFKCTVTTVAGIRCFDLTDRALQLKTKSSYRLIPVHHSIDDPEQMLEDYRSMSSQYISRQFKVEEGTLYSLRHSFATQLASKGVDPHIISELLGHTHNGMTLGRYVKGFPIKLLSESINKVDAV